MSANLDFQRTFQYFQALYSVVRFSSQIILLTILIILYALTSCKEKIQEKKGNEDNWKVYQQLEEKEEQNIQNPFIREETKCILTEKEKQELRNQLLKIVTQCKDIYHPIIDQTTGYQSISREEVKKIKKRFGENGLVCVAENMNMENYEKVEEFYLDYLEDRETDVTIYEVNNDGSFCSETFIYRNKVLQTFTMTLTWEKGEQAEISNGTANNIAEIKYTSKGYLIYSYEYIVAHAALKEYYRVKPLSDTLRILTDQYVSVFNYLNYNFLTQNWDESNVETILLPRLFEDLYQVHTGEQLKKDSGRISAEIYENVMIACLPVTIEELRKHCGYDMESNTYDINNKNNNEELVEKWEKGELSMKDYLYDQIGVGNINSDIIASEEEYLNKDEIYESLVSFIVNELQENSQFDELINKYLVLNDEILPDDIVRLLYEQQFLNPEDEDYENWNRGLITTFDLLIKKIQKLEITPADLALDPCSGSAVVTDTATGKVLACVSYPGYDNNRLANQMDNKYYYKIYNNASLPLFNRATQQLSAPGSTFKPVTIIAGLEEGVIDESTMVECDGVFDKVDPPLKCWNHAGHGAVNGVDSALKNSCNDYLCEVSYRLGMIDNDEFSDKQALNYIQEYAKMFDLDEKSGIELTESKPKITDNYAIPSAIGQGTNNFSTVQLGRYVTTLANEGTSFQLSLIDKIDGVETSPKVESQIEINKRSWEGVHAGMELYTQSTGIFDGFPISVAGKSGTAQEVKNRPDHGLFIGYAPADDPEIAVAVRIVNGYEAGNAVECGKNIFEYYFGIE